MKKEKIKEKLGEKLAELYLLGIVCGLFYLLFMVISFYFISSLPIRFLLATLYVFVMVMIGDWYMRARILPLLKILVGEKK